MSPNTRLMRIAVGVGTLGAIGFSGCADMQPFWLRPGPAELQRIRAEYIDPYPEPDIGPAVVGSRPREYQLPAPENERVQNEQSFSQRYQQPPPAGLFKPTPFSLTPPPPAAFPFSPAAFPGAGPIAP